jgi:DNA-binding beta-propeller fold protein YncE
MMKLANVWHCSRISVILAVALIMISCAKPSGLQVGNSSGGIKTTGEVLTHLYSLTGARLIPRPTDLAAIFQHTSSVNYLSLLSPTRVSGNAHYLYIVDSGRRQIYQYDQAQQGMFLFADLPKANITSITVAADLSLYVADTSSHSVLHFSSDGRLLQTFSNSRELAQPVAVATDFRTGQVIVADSLYNQIVVFDSLGRLQSIIRTPQTRSIAAMARGPDGFYLLDRLSRKVVVIGNDGMERSIFGSDTLKDPVAIAVDRYNRTFIGDNFDNTIKVYEQGRWRETFGGTGPTPGLFNRGNGIWVERDILYVADSLNARIQVFRIAPPGEK